MNKQLFEFSKKVNNIQNKYFQQGQIKTVELGSLYFKDIDMIKRALKSAVWISFGVTVGTTIFIVTSPVLYEWSAILAQTAISLSGGYIGGFIMYLFIYCKSEREEKNE
jgi:presenilin-like A22 family membrane protease